MRSVVLITVTCLFLTGCAGGMPSKETLQYVTDTYPDNSLRIVETSDGTWNVFEANKGQKVAVVMSRLASGVVGTLHGASLGLADTTPDESKFRKAANQMFADAKRNCSTLEGKKLSINSYEFEYTCKG